MWFMTDWNRKIKKGTIERDPETGEISRIFNGNKQIYARPDEQDSGWHLRKYMRPVRIWEKPFDKRPQQ